MVLCAIRSIVYVWYASQGRADMFFSNLRVNKWGGASLIASHRSTAVLPAKVRTRLLCSTQQYTACKEWLPVQGDGNMVNTIHTPILHTTEAN